MTGTIARITTAPMADGDESKQVCRLDTSSCLFVHFPKIKGFHAMIKEEAHERLLRHTSQAPDSTWTDDDDADREKMVATPMPTVTFGGTVKLHGTNAAIGYRVAAASHGDKVETLWAQSRNRVLPLDKDNAGFAAFLNEHAEEALDLMRAQKLPHCVLFGEWCGSGCARGTAISNLTKRFMAFDLAKISTDEWGEVNSTWIKTLRDLPPVPRGGRFDRITNYPQFSISIDLGAGEDAQEELERITSEIDKHCPVAEALGSTGVGEGVVWREIGAATPLRFKTKGAAHRVTQKPRAAGLDPVVVKGYQDFAARVVTEARGQQGLSALAEAGEPLRRRSIGKFLAWVASDVMDEEEGMLEDNPSLQRAQVIRYIKKHAAKWFLEQIPV